METAVINISIPTRLLELTDARAKKEFCSRSGLIREALKRYLSGGVSLTQLYSYGERKAKEVGLRQEDLEKVIGDYRKGK